MSLYTPLFYAAEINPIFSESNTIAQMIHVEVSLARAQAKKGLFSIAIADSIQSACRVDKMDIERLKSDTILGGNIAIPLVKQLTQMVKKLDEEASKFIHLGATSQDIVDTATVLQIRDYLVWIEDRIQQLEKVLIVLTQKHAQTLMVGRTLLQQAKPTTFGFKTAGWLTAVSRSKVRLQELKERVLVIQLNGAVGNGNSNISIEIQEEFAHILGLSVSFSWHTHRDNLAELASALGILGGSLGKIAKDISLLMQTEIAEVFEGVVAGKGGSSTMPHKRNPVTCAAILANAHRLPHLVATMLAAMPQEQERSAGLWHSEWEVLTAIMQLTAGSLEKSIALLEGLEVDEKRMLANLELTKGLIYAENVTLELAKKTGKARAYETVEQACKIAIQENRHLKEVLSEMNPGILEMDVLFEPKNAIGLSLELIEQVVKKYENEL